MIIRVLGHLDVLLNMFQVCPFYIRHVRLFISSQMATGLGTEANTKSRQTPNRSKKKWKM